MTKTVDLVVVGAGPAGLAVAIEARLRSIDVVVVDRAPAPPIDKACGEGLLPDGVQWLDERGIVVAPAEAIPFHGIRWSDEGGSIDGELPERPGLGIRRTALHRALVARAEALGAELRWGAKVDGLAGDPGDRGAGHGARPELQLASGEQLAADLVVAADGIHSVLRRRLGLEVRPRGRPRFGLVRHYPIEPWTNGRVEVHWGDGAEAYVTPVGGDAVGIAILKDTRDRAPFDELVVRFPSLARRLAAGDPAAGDPTALRPSGALGAGPFGFRSRRVVDGRVAFVGDAARAVDPLTGEGLALGFRQAEALVAALAAGRLGRYPSLFTAIIRRAATISRLLLACARHPRLRRRVLATLARDPALFSRLLAGHVGASSSPAFAAVVARLLLRMAAPAADGGQR